MSLFLLRAGGTIGGSLGIGSLGVGCLGIGRAKLGNHVLSTPLPVFTSLRARTTAAAAPYSLACSFSVRSGLLGAPLSCSPLVLASTPVRVSVPHHPHLGRLSSRWLTTKAAGKVEAAQGAAKRGTWDGIKRMWSFTGPGRSHLYFGMAVLPIALSSTMAMPYFAGQVMDKFVDGQPSQELTFMMYTLVGIFVVGAVAAAVRSYSISVAGEIIGRHMRDTLFGAITSRPTVFFDKNKTGDLINRLSTDTGLVSAAVTESVSIFLRSSGLALGGTGFLFYTAPNLAAVSCLAVVPLALYARYFGGYLRNQTTKQLSAQGVSTSVAEEVVSSVRTVQLFDREKYEQSRYNATSLAVFEIGRDISKKRAVFMGTTDFLASATYLSVLGYGSLLVGEGLMTVGQLTSFLLYTSYVGGAFFSLSSVYTNVMKALGACERIMTVTHPRAEDTATNDPVPTGSIHPPALVGDIVFRDIAFAYPSRPSQRIFDGLSLTVPHGKVLAVVGGSGSGKSTLISLLTRLYEPLSGSIALDGQNLKDIEPSWLRRNVGVVTQDSTVFHTTIRDNIRYGKLDATEDEIVSAAKAANAHDFIMGFPDKYDTVVGERGASLSGGQKQRVCIARVLLKNPSVLLLDEATSALDVESELLVQEALDNVMKGRTVVVITHRMSTLRAADFIAFVENGKVTQMGKREDMIAEGRVRDFFQKQNLAPA